jgi:hypothetical protein
MKGNKVTVKPIHDVDEFITTFKVGEEFSVIDSWKGNPHGVTTLTILGFFTYDRPESSLHGNWKARVRNEASNYEYDTFVGDLVNNLHGCFANRSDAEQELLKRLVTAVNEKHSCN